MQEQSDSFYQRLVESVSDYAIYMISVDGCVCSWNLGAQRFKGYCAEEIIGEHFSRFYPDEDRARGMPARALKIAAEEGRFEDRAWRVRKGGERFRAHVVIDAIYGDDNELVGFAKITRDISDAYAAEQRLIDSERRFRLLVSGVTDYAIYMLDLNGLISSWNSGAERFKQYREAEVLGRHFSLFYTPTDAEQDKPARALRIAREQGRYEDHGWRIRKDGSRFWAHVVLDLLRDESGTPIGYAKITRDVSERRESELRIRDLQNTNRELEEFVQVASHDLREPLRKVLAFSDLLEFEAGDALQGDQRSYLTSITSATRRMQGLLDSLLNLSRVTAQGGQFVRCDLNAALGEVVSDLEVAIADAGATLEVEPLPTLQADPAQVRQLFQNLLENALKYADPARPPKVRVRCLDRADPDLVHVEVQDNGIGFDDRFREQIFGIFQRLHTRDQYPGAGVGLSICRKICERHGGRISAMSGDGQGSRFEFSLRREHTIPTTTEQAA